MRNAFGGLVVAAALILSACAPEQMPSRGFSDVSPAVAGGVTPASQQYDIRGVVVDVPRSLLVSEADIYLPNADIVWHGDPPGDRHAQVQKLFEDGFAAGTADMKGERPVKVYIKVEKFHAVTPKTRATFGGNFAMHFWMTVQDASTGEVIDGPRRLVADVRASGGIKALREEAAGITQTTVIVGHLAQVFRKELSRPGHPAAVQDLVSRNAFSPSDLTLAQ